MLFDFKVSLAAALIPVGCALFNLITLYFAWRSLDGLRSIERTFSGDFASTPKRFIGGRFDLSNLRTELQSQSWSEVQVAWNELTLELQQLRSQLSLYRQTLPRVCAFSSIMFAVFAWVNSGSALFGVTMITFGVGAMTFAFIILTAAKNVLDRVYSALEPTERRLLRQERAKYLA